MKRLNSLPNQGHRANEQRSQALLNNMVITNTASNFDK